MHIIRRKGWELPESLVTSEAIVMNRRSLLKGAGAASLLAAGSMPSLANDPAPTDALHPYPRNAAYDAGREITAERFASNYNNFYEFGTSKATADAAQALKTRPWKVKIDGLVEKSLELGIDDIIARLPREERVYRFRCVEGWSMVVPWSGFPMKALVDLARPLGSAKYIRMETFSNPSVAPGQKQIWYPWPYVEGMSMAEATNDLTLMVTGAYGKPLAKQFGAPMRLILPWKYGFKSIKSITRITFQEARPKSFWEVLQGAEYGFWANVNPEVAHPRWSQATEQVLGTNTRIPTLLFNGYGAEVADMYKGMEKERLWA
jgi:sulfoxide reductase catalytic subunit YedY